MPTKRKAEAEGISQRPKAVIEAKLTKGLEKDAELDALAKSLVPKLEGEITGFEKASVGRYDPVRFGPLVSFDGLEGLREVERYWVDKPHAFISILFNDETGESLYHVVEPRLTELERAVLGKISEELLDRLPYERVEKGEEILAKKFAEIARDYRITDQRTLHRLWYYLRRDLLGYGRVHTLFNDPLIEDISCDAPNVPIFLYHRKHFNLRTNVEFDKEELDLYITRLIERCGKHISLGRPVVDAALPEGHRVQATYSTEVTSKGSSFSIRKYMGGTFTPVDLINHGTYSPKMLAYLWLAAENRKSIMVIGGTAVGKTSTLNALAFFIPPDAKICSIEDTREVSLTQQNWIPSVTREVPGAPSIDMHDLVRQAVRQRPECIIVGEVRGKEALAMFQALAIGHTTYCTMHAGSVQEAVLRLGSEPMNVPHNMLAALDLICLQTMSYVGKRRVRRGNLIVEFAGLMDPSSKEIRIIETFGWDPATDSFKELGEPRIWRDICQARGWSLLKLEEEYRRREKFLESLAKRGVTGYDDVATLTRIYNHDPEKAFKALGEFSLKTPED